MALADGRPPAGRIRLLLATGFGLGYAPVAPGTFGSLPGVLLSWALSSWGGWPLTAAGLLLVGAAGFWTVSEAARHFGSADPGQVVIDEIAGQMLTFLFVTPTMRSLVLGFLLFRVSDILKPYPARRLERLPGGSGIMADDLVAGVYANLALHLALYLIPA